MSIVAERTGRLDSIRKSFKATFFSLKSISGSLEGGHEELLTSHVLPESCGPIDSFFEKFRLLEVLGEGASAVVRKCEELSTKKLWAVKITRTKSEEVAGSLLREAENLKRLSHPNVVHFEQQFTDSGRNVFLAVMELAPGETLSELLRRQGALPPETARSVFFQAVRGVRFLHGQRVVHRDLKPANIVVSRDLSSVKIVDFNVAKFAERRRSFEAHPDLALMGSLTGSLDIRAPEMRAGGLYGREVDLWALGCCLVQMLTGLAPFEEGFETFGREEVTRVLEEKFEAQLSSHGREVPELALDLVRKLLEVDPKKRISAEETLAHPWLRSERKMSCEVEVQKSVIDTLEEGSEEE